MFSFFKKRKEKLEAKLAQATQSEEPTAPMVEDDKNIQEADALIEQGNALEDAGKIKEAIVLYEQALTIVPNYWRAYVNQAIAEDALGHVNQALDLYQKAYDANPDAYQTCYNLGRALYLASRDENQQKAQKMLQEAVKNNPDFADAWFFLAKVQEELKNKYGALLSMDKVIALQPDNAIAKIVYARYLDDLDRSNEAKNILQELIDHSEIDEEIKMEAINKVTSIYYKQGRIQETLSWLEQLVQSNDLQHIYASLMRLLYTEQADNHIEQLAFKQLNTILPSSEYHGEITQSNDQKIHLGFISPDLHWHKISYFVESLWCNLEQERFDISVYHTGKVVDSVTEKLQKLAPNWHDVYNQTPERVADLIRENQVDILIDLAGHSSESCVEILAQKPAPYIVTWIGYLASTGLKAVDYRLTDVYTDPVGLTEQFHTEKLIRLPIAQWCYQIQPFSLEIAPIMPYRENGYITFGSFNQGAKLSERILRLWAKLLNLVPNSRLNFAAMHNLECQNRVMTIMQEQGIDSSRLTFLPYAKVGEYFQSYNDVDIALDSFPYTGATTTCDALTMGVPVLTLTGERSVNRSAASLLQTLGHPEWIADNEDTFIANALTLVEQVKSPEYDKVNLRQEFAQSPITDGKLFAQYFAEAMQNIIDKTV